MLHCAAGGDSAFYATHALHKTADIVKTWPAPIQSSQELAGVKGIGRGSQYWVGIAFWEDHLAAAALFCLHCLSGIPAAAVL